MSRSISSLSIEITRACNLNCGFCYLKEKERERDIDLPLLMDFLYKNLDYVNKPEPNKKGIITLTGGEPFLRKKSIHLISRIVKNSGKQIHILTNGSFDPDYLKRMEEKPDALKISLDFPDDRHDRLRGRDGLFDNVVRVIETARGERIPAELVCTVTKSNIRTLSEMYGFSREHRIVVNFNRYIPSSMDDQLTLDGEQMAELFEFVRTHNGVGYMGGLSHFAGRDRDSACFCTAGLDKAHVTVENCISPCMYYPRKYGTIRETLKKVHNRMINFRVEKAMEAMSSCRDCEFLGKQCRGDCLPIADLYGSVRGQCPKIKKWLEK